VNPNLFRPRPFSPPSSFDCSATNAAVCGGRGGPAGGAASVRARVRRVVNARPVGVCFRGVVVRAGAY